jgi:excisionase family DNA binding protein
MVTRLQPNQTDKPLLEQIHNLIALADPTEFTTELQNVVGLLEAGNEVVCTRPDSVMSPQEAADFLQVSRPYIYRLLDRGVLPFHAVGRDRRIPADALFNYATRRDIGRKQLAETFASAEQDRKALIAELAGLG